MRQFSILSIIVLLVSSCATSQNSAPLSNTTNVVNQRALEAHIKFLSSDLLAGRDTGSDGYLIAANYVAAHFQSLGLFPGGTPDSYFQDVPLIVTRLDQSSPTMVFNVAGEDITLSYPEDFLSGSDPSRPESLVTGETVFVGYGIVSDQMNHNDYAGLDVTDKIVVVLTGRPEHWPSEEGAHLGRGLEKARTAAAHGAIGMITLHTTRAENLDPYVKSLDYLEVPSMSWVGSDGQIASYVPEIIGGFYVRPDAAKGLFTGALIDLDSLLEADLAGEPIAGFPLKASVTLGYASTHERMSSPNVIGILEGSDPALRDEYLVYTAHLDHLGIIKNQDGVEEIHPGTTDNATGIATMLETARILAAEQSGLRRSVIFIALTGEEKGLRGAGYFANYPTVPIDNIVANINLDMPFLGFRFTDVVAYGAQHSSLKAVVSKAAAQTGLTLSPDQLPEEAIFVRSDHYRFVQKGIPSVMLATGFGSADKTVDGGALFRNFLQHHYHRPSDNLDQTIDYEAAAAFTEVNINIGRLIGKETTRPTWNKNDFFGDLFAR